MSNTPAPRITLARARKLAPSQAVPSPCVGVCRMHPVSGLCEGCWRSIDEIVGWGSASPAERLRVWGLIEARQSLAPAGS